MNKKGVISLMYVLVILIILFLTTIVIATIIKTDVIIPGGRNKVICDVRIHDPIVGEPNIDSYICEIQGTCLLTIQPLSIFSNVGFVELTMGGASTKQDYKTFKLTGDDETTLKLCTDSTTGTLRLTDENGKTIDSKSVNVG